MAGVDSHVPIAPSVGSFVLWPIVTILAVISTGKQRLFATLRFNREWSMTEVEYNRVLDAVSSAVARKPRPLRRKDAAFLNQPPVAANDNGLAWPLIPFPEGWGGSC